MKTLTCVLGSQSPRRQELMRIMGIPFVVRVSDVEEDFPSSMNVREVAAFLARKKAEALRPSLADHEILITADSTVICDGKIYNKPADFSEARDMLRALSGKTHDVITGVWIGQKEEEVCFSDITKVTFSPLNDVEIEHYINTCSPYDKAGSYGIQDWIGIAKVKDITGSYTNVMGLPTERVYHELKKYFQEN